MYSVLRVSRSMEDVSGRTSGMSASLSVVSFECNVKLSHRTVPLIDVLLLHVREWLADEVAHAPAGREECRACLPRVVDQCIATSSELTSQLTDSTAA